MQIRLEVYYGKPGLHELAPSWRLLTRGLENKRHFHCIEWYMALAETFEIHHPKSNLLCFGVFASNELLAVFPFRAMPIEIAGVQLRALQLLSDACEAETARDFIMAGSLANSDFFQNFVGLLDQHEPSWDVISLRGILDDSFAASALNKSSSLPLVKTPGGHWGKIDCVSCGDDGRHFKRLSKGFRQNLRTARNKLKSRAVNFVSARKPDDLWSTYPEFLQVESSGWKGAEGTSILKQPVADTFLRNLISHFGPIGGCEIHLLKVDNRTVAALFCIVVNDIWCILRTGYDEGFGILSPGHLIIEDLLQDRATTGTLTVLTPYNAPPWFRAWKPDIVMGIHNAYVFRPSQRGFELAEKTGSALSCANTAVP